MPQSTTAASPSETPLNSLLNKVEQLGGNMDDVMRLTSDASLLQQTAELLVQCQLSESFPLSIDYSQPLQAMLDAANYDYINPEITEQHFATQTGPANVEAILVHIGHTASDDEVNSLMEQHDLRAATLIELIAFSVQHPDQKRQFPIVAAGTVWEELDHPHQPHNIGSLWESPTARGLGLDWLAMGWCPCYRFLAIRKQTSDPTIN